MSHDAGDEPTADDDLLADLFDSLLQDILEGRTPDLASLHPERPDLRERIARTWELACSVAGRRSPSQPVFGGYEILRELGHGGMGTVYLARNESLRREVALKVLPHSLAMSASARQRFLEEARALAQLRHEHVVHVHRVVDHSEMLAFEMEYVDGPSLQRLLAELRRRERPQAIETVAAVVGVPAAALGARSAAEWFVRVTIRIAYALEAVHRTGLVHRDVKPANILLRSDGTPLLADFGLALACSPEGQGRRFAGTPVYAAPERLRGEEAAVGARSDVYSLGVTLYEALSLAPPFHGSSTEEVLRGIEGGATTTLDNRAPHVSRDLATIVQKAMEPRPEHRYATAEAFADDLQRLLDLQPIVARPAGPLRRFGKFLRRHQKATLAAAAAATLVALFLWPLATMAAKRDAARREAAAERHAARTQLLCLESLPTASRPGALDVGGRAPDRRSLEAQQQSLDRALEHYRRAMDAAPDDELLRLEAAVVAAARASAVDETPPPAQGTHDLPPLTRDVAARQRTGHDGHARSALLQQAAPQDRYAAGLLAFLLGDADACAWCWRDLTPELAGDALVDAATALRLAATGDAGAAYPRMFHAARTFPDATALELAMAEGAAQSGDLALARAWLDHVPAAEHPLLDATRRLVEADLLAAEGDLERARRRYREVLAVDPSDPRPVLRLARLAFRANDVDTAERTWQYLLRRWPALAPARQQLARLSLQRHDVAGYLAHVRAAEAAGQTREQIAALLRLGGLRPDRDGERLHEAAVDEALPLAAWLSPVQVRGMEHAVALFAEFDRIVGLARRIQPRPVATELLAASLGALRYPQFTMQLPTWARIGLGLAPLAAGPLFEPIGARILPYQTVLGSRIHLVRDPRLYVEPGVVRDTFHGTSLVRLADADGDGLPELAVAAPRISGRSGSGFVELRSIEDGSLLRTWKSEFDSALFAQSIAALGDVDGDLCDDLLIGAPAGDPNAPPLGSIELRSGRTGERIWRHSCEWASFGASLAALDDVDGDGVRDFVAGGSPASPDEQGFAWVHSGRDGRRLLEFRAPRAGSWFGASVAAAGDFDGDGDPDVLAAGNFGKAAGLAVVFDARSGEGVLEVADEDPSSGFGQVVAALGDVDGDGADDVAISAPGTAGGAGTGRVLVISGRTGKSLYELRGDRSGDTFGTCLCRVADWRGDGRPAVAVAARRGGPIGTGYVRVFDLRSGAPLQTFAGAPGHGVFGLAIVDLGDRDANGLPELGITSVSRNGDAALWAMGFDSLPSDVRQGLRRH